MHIFVRFHFNHETSAVAITGVEGDIADILLPSVGDFVKHTDSAGLSFEGTVTKRIFNYELPDGRDIISGTIVVTLCLDRIAVH